MQNDITTFILVRHGETEWNRLRRFQGHVDTALSAHGLEQAQHLAQRFGRGEGLLGADAIYSSDLARARQTAEPLAARLGLPLELRAALRERSYGVFEGHGVEQMRAKWPEEYATFFNRDPDFAPPDGESHRTFYERVIDALCDLAREHRGQTVICVAHGGVLDSAHRYAINLPLEDKRPYPLLNASINIVEFHSGAGAHVKSWGDVEHLVGVGTQDDSPGTRGSNDKGTGGGDPSAYLNLI